MKNDDFLQRQDDSPAAPEGSLSPGEDGLSRDALISALKAERDINRLYLVLAHGRGLKGLVELADEFLQHPIAVCDSSYMIIESSASLQRISYGLGRNQSVTFLEGGEIESLRRLHIEEQIYKEGSAFLIRSEDHPDNNWIFCAIRIHNVMVGYVAVCLEADIEATEYELRITTALADACSVEMQKHDFFVTRSGLKYENFLVELLEGHFHDVNLISSRLELLDRKFCRYFCIIVFQCNEPHDSNIFNKRQMSILRNMYPNSMSVVYEDSIVLFINQEQMILFNEAFLSPIGDFARRNRMKAGFSQPFTDILRINAYYLQAKNTLRLGESWQPKKQLYFASELLPRYIFSKTDYMGLEIGIHHHLHILNGYDINNNTEFLLTMRTYLTHDRNATKAAEALHIHRSTFFYRIKKIEELLDISISDSGLMFLYELSFQVWDYLSGETAE